MRKYLLVLGLIAGALTVGCNREEERRQQAELQRQQKVAAERAEQVEREAKEKEQRAKELAKRKWLASLLDPIFTTGRGGIGVINYTITQKSVVELVNEKVAPADLNVDTQLFVSLAGMNFTTMLDGGDDVTLARFGFKRDSEQAKTLFRRIAQNKVSTYLANFDEKARVAFERGRKGQQLSSEELGKIGMVLSNIRGSAVETPDQGLEITKLLLAM